MIVVLDTNVIVSGLLSPQNAPGRILEMLLSQEISVTYDERILSEYREVLGRSKFGFDPADVDSLLDFIAAGGTKVSSSPLDFPIADSDDLPFLEIATEIFCLLITGNLRHFPPHSMTGIPILTPAEFIELWQSKQT